MSVPKTPRLPGGRLAFERAIRYSSLPAPARHLALTIATWADIATGLIPERFQPSISVLAEATGMGATTVKRHLLVLEEAGWLLRDRPEIWRARKEHARTQYALAVPEAVQGHGPLRAMPGSGEDHAMDHTGPRHGPDGTEAGSAAGHKSSLNAVESPVSTSSSVADAAQGPTVASPSVADGGGGGSLDDSRSTAIYIAGALDYRGKPPTQQQRKTIEDRLTAALASGWTLDGLALYLDLGDAPVQSPAAVYLHRLKPGVLPDAEPLPVPQPRRGGARGELPTAEDYANATLETVLGDGRPDPTPAGVWEQATQRARGRLAGTGARGGTDDRVAGWGAVARQLGRGPHRPYSNDAWSTAAIEAEAVKIPHCGDLDCDEKTRMRDGRDHNELPYVSPCPKCHPRMQW